MRLDGGLTNHLGETAEVARRLEAQGYDGVFTAELKNDPFLPLVLAAQATSTVELGTGIAVAFARNPMTLANTAYDLQTHSRGRFILGLGSQIKPHITKRFSMEWSSPAARMREMIQALHAIWDSWEGDGTLDFRGDFYQHTLMTPMFNPGPNPFGKPKVFLAAVGPLMTEVAGEVADGFLAHGFTTPDYMRDVTLPALAAGAAAADRTIDDIEVSLPLFVVAGETDAERHERAKGARQQLAFYGSTPAYKGVLEHHGWDDLQPKLNAMSKRGEWVEMAALISDDMLHTFAAVGSIAEIPDLIGSRYGDMLDRVQFHGGDLEPDQLTELSTRIRAL